MCYNTRVVADITPDFLELMVLFSQLKSLVSSPFLKMMNVFTYSYHKSFTIFAWVLYQPYNESLAFSSCLHILCHTAAHIVNST